MGIKYYLRLFLVTLLIAAGVIFMAAVPFSCRITEDGITIVEEDVSVPKIVSFRAGDNSTLILSCTKSFDLGGELVKNLNETYYQSQLLKEYQEDGKTVVLTLPEQTVAGESYIFEGEITDKKGNTLTFSLPFTGFNENPARLLLSEIRTKHSTSSGEIKKSEYAELYVLEEGCTAGLEIISGSDGESKKYVFPAVDVKKGEYIVVHFRQTYGGSCTDETGDNLELSTAADSSSARDLWVNNTESRISESDVIVLRDSCRDKIIDAVLYSVSGKTDWYYSFQKVLASVVFESGIWEEGFLPENAAVSDGLSLTRTMSRLNAGEIIKSYNAGTENGSFAQNDLIKVHAGDWAVVSGATPGAENSKVVYVKQE
jgi:hypothetical protein